MADSSIPVTPLSEMTVGQLADTFALLSEKQELKTRDGKPYWRVVFRDAAREVAFPIWQDATWAEDCRDSWTPGLFYKIRAEYRETTYGPQLDIHKIRETTDADAADGFDPAMCLARSRFDPNEMFAELVELARERIADAALAGLATAILEQHREALLTLPAAQRNHHAYLGGYLEHVLSVTRNGVWLAEKYSRDYPDMQPPLSTDLVIAGAMLHDIGKLIELEQRPQGASYTAAGNLIGHILLGRDLVRDAARDHEIDPETLLRLEHIIVSHQRLPEWGSPKPPMTPEALIVHYADDLDAKYQMMAAALAAAADDEPFTDTRNPLRHRIFRGNA
jgi:3'-5' exoribonuclease